MVKSKPSYILVFTMFILTASATHWMHTRPMETLLDANLNALPMNIGAWHGENAEIDNNIKGALEADKVLFRTYSRTDAEDALALLVVYRKYGRRGFAHRPEMCYPAAGWEIVSKRRTSVPYGGHNVQAVEVIAQKNYERQMIVYWFASGHQVEANFVKQQVEMALDRLRPRKYGWAFIRISSDVEFSDADTLRGIRSFMRKASHPLMDTLTSERVGGKG